MASIRKIIVACDFSDYSPAIMRHAASLAADLGAELVAVNVINQRDVNMMHRVAVEYPGFSVEEYIAREHRERISKLTLMVAETGFNPPQVRHVVRVGVPFQEILDLIDSEDAGLLVMGTRGRGHLAGVILGSTAEKIFRRCPIPLMSIREKSAGGE